MTSSSLTDEIVYIVRSPRDKRDYRSFTLANGLTVVVAHCPDSHKGAAALAVNAGHFDDPKHTQGLAHFLEHMLFLGNQTYPSTSAFSDFLNAYGGQQNAWTGTEYSNFYFDCQAKALAQSLDYFAAMFQQPLFAEEWIEKERQSIESEFRLKQHDELRRLYQVHKSTSNPAHPFSQFSVGNLNTLNDDHHGTLAEKLRHFFNAHYVTDKLRLVIAGPQSLDELQQLAVNSFSALPQTREAKPKAITEPLYQEHQLGVWLQVKPVKEARRLIITLPLPSIDDDYPYKTTSFIAHILGYEGPNSLFSSLRQKGWVNSLSAGGGISGSNFKDFNINIQLTEDGEQHALQVAQWVFSYLRLIKAKGIEQWRYQERRITSELSFKYQEPAPVGELVSQLAINSHHYPTADVIFGDYRMDKLNETKAADLLALMVPHRARITLVSSDANTDQITPIYDTPYSIRSLRAKEIEQLTTEPADFCAQLPIENRFITNHIEPYELESQRAIPQALVKTPQLTLWHLQDQDFRVPKGHIYLNIEAPKVTESESYFACSRIWSELMIDALNEDLYDAEVAGLHFNIYPTQTGITIHTTGLSAGQLPLLEYLIEQAWQVRFSRRRWQAVKQQLVNNWQSAHQSQPLNLLFSELNLSLQQGLFRLTDMADTCRELSYAQFCRIVSELFKGATVTSLMHGDWQQRHAQQLQRLIEQHLAVLEPEAQARLDTQRIRTLQPFESQTLDINHKHSDKAVLVYFQGPDGSAAAQVAIMLLQQLIHQFIFNELRTQRQLGYMAGSQYFALQRVPGIIIFVQSPNQDIDSLKLNINEVLQLCADELDSLTIKQWAHNKSVMREQLQVNDRSLRVRSQRYWGCIQLQDTKFNRAEVLTRALDNWQLDDWLAYIHRLLFKQPASMTLQTLTNKG